MSNQKLTLVLCGATLAMFGFGFALIPLYDILCEQLGINGKTSTVASETPIAMQVDESRTIKVEFVSHIPPGLPIDFEPQNKVIQVHPGEVIRTAYIATNQSQAALIAQAVPSVTPGLGATHFNKIECFCFNQQPLKAKQQAELPLIFYVEHDLPDSIHTLTLSYTLYDISDSVEDIHSKFASSAVSEHDTQGDAL
ncbi:cytochrome c oxidase assembly protein [Vibrio sp. UCD-FRSSP16_10]|uniref:cytochrome c oxidase assembly protein n=1 Tax=unclassified Vibrio TaxID=2614977 RepID=UPI0007FEEA21|nr:MULTISPECIES: cytochrome c oxidase assembly protein [unclassified Vibrio]OBT16966.1 cytochrome c oxidase assembly protein [Vibrio sp. UCD-FRSSP16_30]OBT21957.1 cytochrome c oxidase assembly protein [Vibrio sp. UCD-FRSSP16_10]